MSPSPGQVLTVLSTKAQTVTTLARAGVISPTRPDRLVQTAAALLRWGPTLAAGYTVAAARHPDEVGVVDELGTVTFRQLHERQNALAHAFAEDGIGPGDGIAIMCRNHRGFIDAVVACSKLGANALFLNTQFSKPQLTDVLERERPAALVYDQEFTDLLSEAEVDLKRYVAWHEPEEEGDDPVIEDLIARHDPAPLSPPKEKGRQTILTSGTTGTPKGASRSSRGIGPCHSPGASSPKRLGRRRRRTAGSLRRGRDAPGRG